MCSDNEPLEMLVVLHTCSFLMSYDTISMSFGDIETTVPYNESIGIYCDLSFGKINF